MSLCIILTTTDTEDNARLIAERLLAESLAACVQISQISSFFRWEGELIEAPEFSLSVKATEVNYEKICILLKEIHNYTLPQIIKISEVTASKEYLEWVREVTRIGT